MLQLSVCSTVSIIGSYGATNRLSGKGFPIEGAAQGYLLVSVFRHRVTDVS